MGSEGFGCGGEYFHFDQQPIEAWATIAACGTAFAASGQPVWRARAETAWRWFLGDNDRGLPLGNVRSGRCLDGLTPRGVNRNCGPESLLAFHLAHQATAETFWPADAGPPPPPLPPPKSWASALDLCYHPPAGPAAC